MTEFNFATDEAKQLWERASPKGDKHLVAWAWREKPAGVDRSVNKIVRKMNEEQVAIWLADCLLSADIQTKYRGEQLKTGKKIGRPQGLQPWLEAGDWAMEIGSTQDLKKKQISQICSTQGCDKPVHGGKFSCCADCLPDSWAADRRSHSIEKGYARLKTETREDWLGRLRGIARMCARGIG